MLASQHCGGGADGGRAAGFTLLEVLIAFAIATLGVAVLLQIYARMARLTDMTDDFSRALAVAQSVMAETGVLERLQAGAQSGAAGEQMRWQRTVEPVEGQSTEFVTVTTASVLYEVTVQVSWGGARTERSLTLRSLRL